MMTRRPPCGYSVRSRRLFGGQASIEYIVVLAFGVMVLLKPFSYSDVADPNAAKTEAPALKQVATAIKDYHKQYTYALAIASIPDCDLSYSTSSDQWTPAQFQGYFPTINLTAGIDGCIDWQNPALPTPSISISPFPTLPSSFGDAIKTIVTEAVDKAVNDLLKPENIAGALGFPTSLPF
jgi:hypothetical protein